MLIGALLVAGSPGWVISGAGAKTSRGESAQGVADLGTTVDSAISDQTDEAASDVWSVQRKVFFTDTLGGEILDGNDFTLRLMDLVEVGKITLGEARLGSSIKPFILEPIKVSVLDVSESMITKSPELAFAIASGHASIKNIWAKFTMFDGASTEALFTVTAVSIDGQSYSGAHFVTSDFYTASSWLDYIRPCCDACQDSFLQYYLAGLLEESAWACCWATLGIRCCGEAVILGGLTSTMLNSYLNCCAANCNKKPVPAAPDPNAPHSPDIVPLGPDPVFPDGGAPGGPPMEPQLP